MRTFVYFSVCILSLVFISACGGEGQRPLYDGQITVTLSDQSDLVLLSPDDSYVQAVIVEAREEKMQWTFDSTTINTPSEVHVTGVASTTASKAPLFEVTLFTTKE